MKLRTMGMWAGYTYNTAPEGRRLINAYINT